MGPIGRTPEEQLLPCSCGWEPHLVVRPATHQWYVRCDGCDTLTTLYTIPVEAAVDWNLKCIKGLRCRCGAQPAGSHDGSYWLMPGIGCGCDSGAFLGPDTFTSPSAVHVVEMWRAAHGPVAILCSCCGDAMKEQRDAFRCRHCDRDVRLAT